MGRLRGHEAEHDQHRSDDAQPVGTDESEAELPRDA